MATEQQSRPAPTAETRGGRMGRHVRRSWLYTWVSLLVATVVLLVILVAENTRRVKVGWVLGYSRISLVFLILGVSIIAWLLGIATAVVFRHRTRPGH